jgi:hypothetical protein
VNDLAQTGAARGAFAFSCGFRAETAPCLAADFAIPESSFHRAAAVPCGLFRTVVFELRPPCYGRRRPGHEQAGSFGLYEQDSEGREHAVAEGADLVWRALQDRANL